MFSIDVGEWLLLHRIAIIIGISDSTIKKNVVNISLNKNCNICNRFTCQGQLLRVLQFHWLQTTHKQNQNEFYLGFVFLFLSISSLRRNNCA